MAINHRQMALALIAATALLSPPCGAPAQGVGFPVPSLLAVRGPSTSQTRPGDENDVREVIKRNAPTVMKGVGIVLVATLLIMTLVLGPIDWIRRIVAAQAEKSGGTALPSSRRYYVKLGSLGVPSEFEWRPPNLFIGGNRFAMQLAKKVKGVGLAWELEDGTRFEFVPKAEVDAERARHREEFRARYEAARSQREFAPDDNREEPQAPNEGP